MLMYGQQQLRPEGGGVKRNFFSFHISDRAAEDEQVEKTDQNPTMHSWDIARQSLRFTYNY